MNEVGMNMDITEDEKPGVGQCGREAETLQICSGVVAPFSGG